jgi:glycosyltransferase involved in cell wall biosynthesis
MSVNIDIVLPCYNPNDKWYVELSNFHQFIKDQYRVNFIVVNDGSSTLKIPGQIELLKEAGIEVNYLSYVKNMGKGYALRHGVAASKSEFIVYTDVDFPFTNQSVKEVIDLLVSGNFDVVAGYRSENYYEHTMSPFRKSLSKTFRSFMKNVLGMTVSDTQCGLKGFNKRGRTKFLSTRINRYLFDFEFIYVSSKDTSVKIGTTAVQLKENIVFSKMRFKILIQEMFNLFYILLFRKN